MSSKSIGTFNTGVEAASNTWATIVSEIDIVTLLIVDNCWVKYVSSWSTLMMFEIDLIRF